MALKLGMTGMDQASEAALRAAFQQVDKQLGGRWKLVSEAEADHVIVDMDSMYGPMSWIRLHSVGKQVIGLTTSPKTQADHRLGRPFDAEALVALLGSIAGVLPAASPSPETASATAEAPPAASTPAPAPADELPEEQLQRADEEAEAPATAAVTLEPETVPAPIAANESVQATVSPEPKVEAKPEPAPEPAARERRLMDWLVPGALAGRWRYRFDGGSVAFDTNAGTYQGPVALKPLAVAFRDPIRQDAFEALDEAGWNAAIAGPGQTQALSRLRWYGGLLAGDGALLPGNDPRGQYRLVKWPQTEREFPRHFRIATAMMKGPATLAEVAQASGVPESEVADFVNANLGTGFAEFVPPAAPEPEEAAKPTGLFGRLRGR